MGRNSGPKSGDLNVQSSVTALLQTRPGSATALQSQKGPCWPTFLGFPVPSSLYLAPLALCPLPLLTRSSGLVLLLLPPVTLFHHSAGFLYSLHIPLGLSWPLLVFLTSQ